MKTRIVQGHNIGTFEVEYKLYWLSPWQPVYINNGLPFPFRGSYEEAQKVEQAIIKKHR